MTDRSFKSMPIVRLAKLSDYVEFSISKYEARTLYKVSWYEHICPGNPTADPATGLPLFNDWQIKRANSEIEYLSRAERLKKLVAWCSGGETFGKRVVCGHIAKIYKNHGVPPKYYLKHRYKLVSEDRVSLIEADLLSNEIMSLSAQKIFELQNLRVCPTLPSSVPPRF